MKDIDVKNHIIYKYQNYLYHVISTRCIWMGLMLHLKSKLTSISYNKKISLILPMNNYYLSNGIKGLLSECDFINGKNIELFEDFFSKYIGKKYAISNSSGRLSLYLILKSLNLKKGDEIIIPAYMLPFIPQIALFFGLTPVFVDVDPYTYNMEPDEIEKNISDKTRVILAVHLFGHACKIDKIAEIAKKNNILLIEDCAQSFGSTYKGKKTGSFADVSYFSFNCTKNISTYGGGMIVTDDESLYLKIRDETSKMPWPKKSHIKKRVIITNIRWFFSKPFVFTFLLYPLLRFIYLFNKKFILNYNKCQSVLKIRNMQEEEFLKRYWYRYTNFQASIGLRILDVLDSYINDVNLKAEFLSKQIKTPPIIIDDCVSSFYRYCIRSENSRVLNSVLFKNGILTSDGSYLVLPNLEIFKDFRRNCPGAEDISNKLLYLPLTPCLTDEDLLKIANLINILT